MYAVELSCAGSLRPRHSQRVAIHGPQIQSKHCTELLGLRGMAVKLEMHVDHACSRFTPYLTDETSRKMLDPTSDAVMHRNAC